MNIDNSILDINNISVVHIGWDEILEKTSLDIININNNNDIGNIGIGVSNPIGKLDVYGVINSVDYKKNGLNISNIFITSNIFYNEINSLSNLTSNLFIENFSNLSNITLNNSNLFIGNINSLSNITSNNSNYFENRINSINYNTIPINIDAINTDNINIGTSNLFITNDIYSNNLRILGKLNVSNIEIYNDKMEIPLIIKQMNSNRNVAEFYNSNSTTFIITSNSNIGIGINIPNQLYKLDVNGNINCSDIYINNSSVNTKLNNNFAILNNFIDNTNTNFLNMITSINNLNNIEKKLLIVRQTDSTKNVIEFYNSNNPTFIIHSNSNVGIGTTNPLYTLDINGTVNCSSIIANGYNITFKKNFYFSPILNGGNYEYTFDIRNYIPLSIGNDCRCFSLYGHNSNGDFTNSSVFIGSYIFYLSAFNGGTVKKIIINETGGTINNIPLYQMKYMSSTSSDNVYITIHQHN